MKQFLVPALLLALVGAAAAIAASSTPTVAKSEPTATCHEFTGMSGVCPMGGERHCDAPGAAECTEAAAEKCPMSGQTEECEKSCEEKQELDCCKKKLECGKCPKPAAPVEKP